MSPESRNGGQTKGQQAAPVPFGRWELVLWASFLAAAVVNLLTSSGSVGIVAASLWVVLVLGLLGWSIRIHRSRQALLSQRTPPGLLWLVGAIAVYFGIAAITADRWADSAQYLLITVGVVAGLVNEKTRDVPEVPLRPQGTGGRFDQTTAAGRARLDRLVRITAALLAVALIVVTAISGTGWGFFGLACLGGGVIGWEATRWYAIRNKVGYHAFDDD
jgi:hypothetical protein